MTKMVHIRALVLCTCFVVSFSSEATNLQRLSRAHLEFALSLFRHLTRDASLHENVVISPHSVASVLSQLWLGAGEGSNTSAQLENVLHYKDGGLLPEQVHDAFKSSLDTIDDPDYKQVVQTANAVFVQAGVSVTKKYDENLRKYYNSSVDEVDFDNGEIVARSIINRWVSQQTQGQIDNLLETPLPSHTRLLLVNALSLKAFWKNGFDPAVTASRGVFHHNSKTKVEIPMMTGKFQVLLGSSNELKCRLLELPFRGRRLSMFIILPDDESSLDERGKPSLLRLENDLTAENLKHLFSTLRDETVQIRMPRFRIAHSAPLALADTLSNMGLNQIFDSTRSDFSGISKSTKLHVSAMAHKVVLEVTEEGAQAAAATAAGIERFGEFGEYFEVNRPFLFFIWDYHSGALLFIGRVVNPEPLLS